MTDDIALLFFVSLWMSSDDLSSTLHHCSAETAALVNITGRLDEPWLQSQYQLALTGIIGVIVKFIGAQQNAQMLATAALAAETAAALNQGERFCP